ncbi:hypothetical protein [Streptomyces sp. NBC_00887]|uniref:hypothetical protein n=1 Tax=Streptomyces sp. NBC_00887 TaxID=2975859 RepID=UPI0038674E9F
MTAGTVSPEALSQPGMFAILAPNPASDPTEAIGGWWNRQNNPEIDLIGADREPVARQVHFVGSVKWLETPPFGRHEHDALVRDMLAVPGTAPDTPLVAVSRCAVADDLPLTATGDRRTSYGAWQTR